MTKPRTSRRHGRDAIAIASIPRRPSGGGVLPRSIYSWLSPLTTPLYRPLRTFDLTDAYDGREFHPDEPVGQIKTLTGAPARIDVPRPVRVREREKSRSKPYKFFSTAVLAFQTPSKVVVCVRRRRRREVMFASGRAGRFFTPKRRTWTSLIRC